MPPTQPVHADLVTTATIASHLTLMREAEARFTQTFSVVLPTGIMGALTQSLNLSIF